MVKKIILIIAVLAIISGGTFFALDRLVSKQKTKEHDKVEHVTEEKTTVISKRTIVEIVNPENPSEIKREWTGLDGLTYKLEAIKNENGTYTGSLRGLNMYDGFVEYNFKFEELSQIGFDHLFDK